MIWKIERTRWQLSVSGELEMGWQSVFKLTINLSVFRDFNWAQFVKKNPSNENLEEDPI